MPILAPSKTTIKSMNKTIQATSESRIDNVSALAFITPSIMNGDDAVPVPFLESHKTLGYNLMVAILSDPDRRFIYTVPPIKPKGGQAFLISSGGREVYKRNWRCDQYRWTNNGTNKFPSRSSEPVIKRHNYILFKGSSFTRTASYLICNEHLVLLHYLGDESEYIPRSHGNRKKDFREHVRTCPSVLNELKQLKRSVPAAADTVYETLTSGSSSKPAEAAFKTHSLVLKPRDKRQIENAFTYEVITAQKRIKKRRLENNSIVRSLQNNGQSREQNLYMNSEELQESDDFNINNNSNIVQAKDINMHYITGEEILDDDTIEELVETSSPHSTTTTTGAITHVSNLVFVTDESECAGAIPVTVSTSPPAPTRITPIPARTTPVSSAPVVTTLEFDGDLQASAAQVSAKLRDGQIVKRHAYQGDSCEEDDSSDEMIVEVDPDVKTKPILCVGLVCLDIISVCGDYPSEDTDQKALSQRWQRGGNASNNCSVLAKLGINVHFAGTIADNTIESCYMMQDFVDYGINTQHVITHPNCSSPLSMAIVNQSNGSRTIMHMNKDLPELRIEEFQKIDLFHYSWVHFETRLDIPTIIEMINTITEFNEYNPESKVTISIEIEKAIKGYEQLFGLTDYTFISKNLAKHRGCKGMEDAILDLFTYCLPGSTLIIPWGDEGAIGCNDDEGLISVEAFTPVGGITDTMGAGDTFLSAFIFTQYREEPYKMKKALNYACQVAGEKCSFQGYSRVKKI